VFDDFPSSGPIGYNTRGSMFDDGDVTANGLILDNNGARQGTTSGGVPTETKEAYLTNPILKSGDGAVWDLTTVDGTFAAILPKETLTDFNFRQSYGIRIRDNASGFAMVGTDDDQVSVSVINRQGGPQIRFRDRDRSANTSTTLGRRNLTSFPSLELILRLQIDSLGVATGYVDLKDGLGFTQLTRSSTPNSRTIFNGEVFTIAGFRAVSPIPEPSTLLFLGFGLLGLGLWGTRKFKERR